MGGEKERDRVGERKRAKDGQEWERDRERERERVREKEREIERERERKIDAPTGVGRDMVVPSFSLPPYLPLSPTPVCASIFLSLPP